MASPRLTLLTYPGNVQALQSLIVARYNGVHLAVPPFEMGRDNKTDAFLGKSPLGKVPVLETPEGSISEPAAIARYVARMRADTKMYGASFFEAGLVDQWVEFAKSELDLPVGMWTFPVIGFVASNAASTERAKQDLARALGALQSHLASSTYLVGQTVTLADIAVACSLLNAFKLVMDATYLEPFGSVVRWFATCVNQPEFIAVLGETKLISAGVHPPPPEKAPPKEKAAVKEKAPAKEKAAEKKDAGDEHVHKEREKLLKKVIKEGGKKGVEIEGASDMGASPARSRCSAPPPARASRSRLHALPWVQAASTSSARRSSRRRATSTCCRRR